LYVSIKKAEKKKTKRARDHPIGGAGWVEGNTATFRNSRAARPGMGLRKLQETIGNGEVM